MCSNTYGLPWLGIPQTTLYPSGSTTLSLFIPPVFRLSECLFSFLTTLYYSGCQQRSKIETIPLRSSRFGSLLKLGAKGSSPECIWELSFRLARQIPRLWNPAILELSSVQPWHGPTARRTLVPLPWDIGQNWLTGLKVPRGKLRWKFENFGQYCRA